MRRYPFMKNNGGQIYFILSYFIQIYTGDLHIRWSTSSPPVDHRMSHPHASGNVPEVVHRMCRIRWTTDVPHQVDHWMCACGGTLDVCIEWLAFGVLCSLKLIYGKIIVKFTMNNRAIFIATGKATETLIGVNMLINNGKTTSYTKTKSKNKQTKQSKKQNKQNLFFFFFFFFFLELVI